MLWHRPPLHPHLKQALSLLYPQGPFPVQASLFEAFLLHDVLIVSSQTGSGKTVAFAAPIISQLLARGQLSDGVKRGLVISPTRELALQSYQNMRQLVPDLQKRGLCSLIGGMSLEKQVRLLEYASLVIGTPGRIVQLMDQNQLSLRDVEFVVIDEADRMVELGAFRQLDRILDEIYRVQENVHNMRHLRKDCPTESLGDLSAVQSIPYEEFLRSGPGGQPQWQEEGRGEADAEREKEAQGRHRVKIIFISATLTKQFKNTKYYDKQFRDKARRREQTEDSLIPKLQAVLSRIGNPQKPKIIDLTEGTVPTTLREMKCFCQAEEKLLYLHAFLLAEDYASKKTIVFCNKISAARQLGQLLGLLGVSAVVLHSQMQQRQRLAKVDRFVGDAPVLVTTDLAARGIDVRVDIVVQYALPRDGDTYIHRVGRTARALRTGTSLIIISRQEAKHWRDVNQELKREAQIFEIEEAKYDAGMELVAKVTSLHAHQRGAEQLDRKAKFDRVMDERLGAGQSESEREDPEERDLRLDAIRKRSLKLRKEVAGARAKARQAGVRQEGQVLRKGRVFLSPEEALRIASRLGR